MGPWVSFVNIFFFSFQSYLPTTTTDQLVWDAGLLLRFGRRRSSAPNCELLWSHGYYNTLFCKDQQRCLCISLQKYNCVPSIWVCPGWLHFGPSPQVIYACQVLVFSPWVKRGQSAGIRPNEREKCISVKTGQSRSELYEQDCGVHQGGCPSPILFNILTDQRSISYKVRVRGTEGEMKWP